MDVVEVVEDERMSDWKVPPVRLESKQFPSDPGKGKWEKGKKKKNRRVSLRNGIFSASSGTGRPGLKGPLLLLPRKKGRRSSSSPLWMLGPPTPRTSVHALFALGQNSFKNYTKFVLKKLGPSAPRDRHKQGKHPQTNWFHGHQSIFFIAERRLWH